MKKKQGKIINAWLPRAEGRSIGEKINDFLISLQTGSVIKEGRKEKRASHRLDVCTSPPINPAKPVVNDQSISLPFFSLPPAPSSFPSVTHPIPKRTSIRLLSLGALITYGRDIN